jgi:hypothetical protein
VGRDAASAVASAGCAVTERAELVSHCDYYPGNVVFRGERPVALIDFDLAHPTTRLYESRTLWYWAPLRDPRDPAAPAPPEARLRTGPLSLPVVSGPMFHRVRLAAVTLAPRAAAAPAAPWFCGRRLPRLALVLPGCSARGPRAPPPPGRR